jgi:hypothetical protein
MKRTLAAMILIGMVTMAMALLSYRAVFDAKYNPAKDSDIGKAKCALCHVGMTKKLNPYGLDLQKALGGSKKMTPEILSKMEALDSDKDGVSNIDEIKAGTLPGVK